MDVLEYFTHDRSRDLEAAATAHRLRRACRRADARPSPAVRPYARLWWASRPRAAVWATGLFDAPARPWVSPQ
jgi:hypothetical protein